MLLIIFSGSPVAFLLILASCYELGYEIGLSVSLIALVASPFLSGAVVLGIAYLADFSDQRARARRIAKAKARKSSVSTTN
ncbi:hypothetical protein [Aeromonas sanarellii]|uniref:hypothetical protein n=1 Tax=Aeromonas sanarellii TaxID=633415 RepID=UPI0038D1BB25